MTKNRFLLNRDRVRGYQRRSHFACALQPALLGGVVAAFARFCAPAAFALALARVWFQALAWKPRPVPAHVQHGSILTVRGPSSLN